MCDTSTTNNGSQQEGALRSGCVRLAWQSRTRVRSGTLARVLCRCGTVYAAEIPASYVTPGTGSIVSAPVRPFGRAVSVPAQRLDVSLRSLRLR